MPGILSRTEEGFGTTAASTTMRGGADFRHGARLFRYHRGRMWHRSSFVLPLALSAAPAAAVVLGAGVAQADPDAAPAERRLPRPVRIERVLGAGVGERSCEDAETIAHGIAAHTSPYQELFDPNAAARLVVTFKRE